MSDTTLIFILIGALFLAVVALYATDYRIDQIRRTEYSKGFVEGVRAERADHALRKKIN